MTIVRHKHENAPRRVVLVGWDAADWQMIFPLIEQGLMPTLAALMQRGAWGNLASLQPMLSPMLWNSIATGKRADQHGVLGFTEPDPDLGGIRPSSSTSRRCKALWNILTQCGLRSNVVGWYASHPAEPINGVMVSNQLEVFQPTDEGITPPVCGSVHPAAMTDELAELRVRPREIDASAILPFVPQAADLIDKPGQRVGKLRQLLAQTSTIHAVATHLMARDDWDFTAVYYEGVDRFGHEFMEFHTPKMDQVSQADFDAYHQCMVGIYRFHDMMLQSLLALAGDDTTVIVMSDHGYYNNHLRPDPRPGKAGPVEWHRPFGMLATAGPGIQGESRLFGASLLDIAPTVLQLFGLPAAYDMPGRVLAEIMTMGEPLPRIESWEEIDGDAGMHPPETRIDPVEAREAMQQLAALGYIEAPSEDADKAAANTIGQNNLTLAQSLADAGDFGRALKVLEETREFVESSTTAQLLLANCYLATGRRDDARAVLESLGDGNESLMRREMMLGIIELAEGNRELALERFERVARVDARLPGLQNKLGSVYYSVKRYQDSARAFTTALEIDPESPVALEGLARAQIEIGAVESALDHAIAAVELTYHFPRAHYTIGKARLALGDIQGAIEALEVCIKQAPRLTAAHVLMARAYRQLGETEKAMIAELRGKQLLS